MLAEDMSRNKCFFFPSFEYHMFYVLYPFVTAGWLSRVRSRATFGAPCAIWKVSTNGQVCGSHPAERYTLFAKVATSRLGSAKYEVTVLHGFSSVNSCSPVEPNEGFECACREPSENRGLS
jgi:hypothetical protein